MRREDMLEILLVTKTNNKETEKDVAIVRNIVQKAERRSAVINFLAVLGTVCVYWALTDNHLLKLLESHSAPHAAHVQTIGGDEDDDEHGSGR